MRRFLVCFVEKLNFNCDENWKFKENLIKNLNLCKKLKKIKFSLKVKNLIKNRKFSTKISKFSIVSQWNKWRNFPNLTQSNLPLELAFTHAENTPKFFYQTLPPPRTLHRTSHTHTRTRIIILMAINYLSIGMKMIWTRIHVFFCFIFISCCCSSSILCFYVSNAMRILMRHQIMKFSFISLFIFICYVLKWVIWGEEGVDESDWLWMIQRKRERENVKNHWRSFFELFWWFSLF